MVRRDKLNLYLDDLADEYKELLLSTVLRNSKDGEVSLSELLKLDESVKNNLRVTSRTQRYQKLQLLGLIYVLVGLVIAFFALYQRYFIYNRSQTFIIISLIMALFGLYIVFFSILLQLLNKNRLIKRKNVREFSIEKGVLELYARLERIVYVIFEDSERITMRESINKLLIKGIISNSEKDVLNDFMSLRNKVVHYSIESHMEFAIADKKVLDQVEQVINRLEMDQGEK